MRSANTWHIFGAIEVKIKVTVNVKLANSATAGTIRVLVPLGVS